MATEGRARGANCFPKMARANVMRKESDSEVNLPAPVDPKTLKEKKKINKKIAILYIRSAMSNERKEKTAKKPKI